MRRNLCRFSYMGLLVSDKCSAGTGFYEKKIKVEYEVIPLGYKMYPGGIFLLKYFIRYYEINIEVCSWCKSEPFRGNR